MTKPTVNIVAPVGNKVDLELFFSDLSTLGQPFSEESVNFVDALSSALLTNAAYKIYPEMIALGFWLRRANIQRVKKQVLVDSIVRLPRGVVFHVAPSNVDTIFIYSLIISLLMGNKNVVRVSGKPSLQKDLIVQLINELLLSPALAATSQNLLIITYSHDDNTSRYLSERVDVRMLWGGDQTVGYFSTLPVRPTSVDVKFANKYSIAIISAKALNNLSAEELNHQAKAFVNDSYSFGQMACSSPRSVCWVGDTSNVTIAKSKFWQAVKRTLDGFDHELSESNYIDKLAYVFEHALKYRSNLSETSENSILTVVNVGLAEIVDTEAHCGSGLFLQAEIEKLTDINTYLSRKIQTLTYLGFTSEALNDWIGSGVYGVDRIVPFGKGVDFDYIWDGVNLFDAVSRIVSVK